MAEPTNKAGGITGLIVIASLTVAMFIFYGHRYARPSTGAQNAPQNSIDAPKTETWLSLDDTDDWLKNERHGVSNFDTRLDINGYLLTQGKPWQVMYDRDTNRIYTLYPAGWSHDTNSCLREDLPANRVDWRILPGYGDGTLVAKLEPKKAQE